MDFSLSVLDLSFSGPALSPQNAGRVGSASPMFGQVRIDFALLVLDFLHLGPTSSLQSFA